MSDSTALDLLASIDATLKAMLALAKARAPLPVADASDLDGKYGDPEVKYDPRDWTGESCKGRRYSECSPEFLDLLAKAQEYFAGQDEAKGELTKGGKPVAPFRRLDAARARGWAKRVRDGWKPPAFAEPDNGNW